jgi:hypothetical protein
MRSARLTSVFTVLLCAAGAVRADDLYVSGRLERISTPGFGGGGGIEWYHSTSSRRTLKLGLSAFALPDAKWAAGGGGATFRFGSTVLATEGTVGHSNVEGSFVHVYGGLTRPLSGPRWAGDVECHFIGARTASGALAKAGLTLLPRPSLTLQAGYFQSFRGTLGTRLAVAKIVSSIGPRRYLVGGSIGRSSPSVLGFIDEQRAQSLRHLFAGAALPLRAGGELLVILEHYDLAVANRSLLSLTWKVGRR